MNATEIIRRLGGPAKVAVLFEISTQAVSQWQDNGIPKARLQYLRLARPDVFEPVPAGDTEASAFQPQ